MGIFLNAGLLKSTSRTIGDYRIEWRKDSTVGEVVFISGIGNDVSLQAQHPIIDEIVESGNLYPIITYVYIDGFKVTSQYEIGVIFSPDLIGCLDFIIIDDINCATLYNEDAFYNFNLSYNNTTSINQDKNRTLAYRISPTAIYLAWKFYGDTIADGLKISYCTLLDPVGVLLDNYIVGFNSTANVQLVEDLTPVDYPNNPKTAPYWLSSGYSVLKQLTDLSAFTYAAGDYIKIEIIGSVLDLTNNNTNWSLHLGCMDSFDNTTFNSLDIAKIDLSRTPTMWFQESNCTYWTDYKCLEIAKTPGVSDADDILKYLSVGANWSSNTSGGRSGQFDMGGDIGLIENEYYTQSWKSIYEVGNLCVNLGAEEQSIDISNGNLTIIFPNLDRYNNSVNNIALVQANQFFIDALTADPTTRQYYSGYVMEFRIAVSCGDSESWMRDYIHHTSVITYDEANLTISFTLPTITNQYPIPSGCESAYDTIQSHVTQVNATAIENTQAVSNITYEQPIYGYHIYEQDHHTDVVIQTRHYKIRENLYNHIFTPAQLTALGFCLYNGWWEMFKQYDRVTMTNPSTARTRLHSWTLERQKRLESELCSDDVYNTSNYELVYTSPNTACGSALVTGTLINGTP